MGFVVLAIGALMSIVGAYEIYYGNSVIAVERGWSAFIGGSVLLSGGVVTAAIGVAVHVLLGLRRMLPAAVPAPVNMHPGDPASAVLADMPAVPPRTEPDMSALVAAPRLDPVPALGSARTDLVALDPQPPHADAHVALPDEATVDAAHTDVVEHKHEPVEPVENEPEPYDVRHEPIARDAVEPHDTVVEAHAAAEPHPSHEPPAHETRSAQPEHEGTPRRETAAAEGLATVAAREAPASPVIGRYESEGTSYVMYADGSIDAQSNAGVYRFASMAELKRFIEG